MPYYLVERAAPSPLDAAARGRLARTITTAAETLGVPYRWVSSIVAGGTMFCVHETDDLEAVQEHARRVGLPVLSITEIDHELGPADAVAPSVGLDPGLVTITRPAPGLHCSRQTD